MANIFTNLQNGYGLLTQSIAIIIFVLLFNVALNKILLALSQKFKAKQKIWKLSFVSALYKPLSYFIWFLALLLAANIFCVHFLGFGIPHFMKIIKVGAVLALGWFLLRWKTILIEQLTILNKDKKDGVRIGSLDLFGKLGTMAIFILVTLLLMEVTGFGIQSILAFGGISGVALAFASQQFISNFFGGLSVHIAQPFSKGDFIQLPERKIEGHIEEIGWYMTSIRDPDKRSLYIPNSTFNQSIILNTTRTTFRRIYLKIGLRPSDISVIEKVVDDIRSLLKKNPSVNQEIESKVFFTNFGPTNLEIEISTYINQDANFEAAKQKILIDLASVISQNGAELSSVTSIIECKSPLITAEDGS